MRLLNVDLRFSTLIPMYRHFGHLIDDEVIVLIVNSIYDPVADTILPMKR